LQTLSGTIARDTRSDTKGTHKYRIYVWSTVTL